MLGADAELGQQLVEQRQLAPLGLEPLQLKVVHLLALAQRVAGAEEALEVRPDVVDQLGLRSTAVRFLWAGLRRQEEWLRKGESRR